VESPSRMTREPVEHVAVFVGLVIVGDDVDELSGWNVHLDSIEETDELPMTMALHVAPKTVFFQGIQGSKQRRGVMALVVMRQAPALPGLERQAGLGAVDRLDLGFLVDREHKGMSGRGHVEAHNNFEFLGELWIARALESAQAMGLKPVSLPDSLNRTYRDADQADHPVSGFVQWLGASQRDDTLLDVFSQRRFTGLAGLVAQKSVDALFGIVSLPAPDGGAACTGAARNFQDGISFRRKQDDLCPGAMLEQAVPVADDCFEASTIIGIEHDADGLGHDLRFAYLTSSVSHPNGSMHYWNRMLPIEVGTDNATMYLCPIRSDGWIYARPSGRG